MAQTPFEKALADEGIVGTPLESLARSIYMQESSGGKNTKTSNAGAVGGMQILPGTFNEMLPGGNINDAYDNSRAGLRYIKKMNDLAGGNPTLTAAGYYGGPSGMNKAKEGVAVSDPRNPKAPTTLQYAKEVTARQNKTAAVPRETSPAESPAIKENIADLGQNYQAAYALMAMADEEPETTREIEAREAAEEQSAAQQFAQIQKQLASLKPASPFAAQGSEEPQNFKDGGEVEAEDDEDDKSEARKELKLYLKKATREESPLDVKFTAPPPQPMVVEGLGVQRGAPPSVQGRVGYDQDGFRMGASGVAVKTPQGVKYMPGMYDVGYRTPMAGGELDMSYARGIKTMPGMKTPQMANVRYVRKFEEGGDVAPVYDKKVSPEKKLANLLGLGPAYEASVQAPKDMGLSGDEGTEGDAVRHMVLMREVSKKYGPVGAKVIGYAHEFGPNMLSGQSSKDREMDLNNNALGLELAKQAGGDEELFKRLVAQALGNKKATYYRDEYNNSKFPVDAGNMVSAKKMLGAMPKGEGVRKRAGGSPEMGEVSGSTFEEGGPENAKRMLKDVVRGVSYYPYDLVGAPVDIINMGLKGVDYFTGSKLATEKPVGGSADLIDRFNKIGIAEKPTGSISEEVARFGSAFINPASGARGAGRVLEKTGEIAAKGAEKAGKLGMDVLEDLSMATTGQGGSKMAQLVTSQAQPSFVAPAGSAKKALEQLDLNMIKATEDSPFVGRLEQALFDNPQDKFDPKQLLGWGRKSLRGSDADRLEAAISPLMGQKSLTKKEVLDVVNQTYSPKRFTIEVTQPNEPIRGNTFIPTYVGEDMPYVLGNAKKAGTIVARKPSNLNVEQLRLQGALDSVITHPDATEAYVRGMDTDIYNSNLNNIQMYLREMPLDANNKKQAAQLFNEFTTSTRELANRNYLSDLHRDYNKTKFDMDEQERLQNIQGIAESLGIDTQLRRLPELEDEVNLALSLSQKALIKEKAKQDTEMMEYFVKNMSPKSAQFFQGRKGHEFQGADAISFSRYVDVPVGNLNLIGVSEFQSDLGRHFRKGLEKTKQVTDLEVYPNMIKRDDEMKQNMIKNVLYGAAKIGKDGVVLPGMMSPKAVLYTDVAKQAKVALKDLGLDTKNIKKINAEQVYDKQKLEDKLVEMYSGMIDTKEANRIFSVKDIPEEIKVDLIQQLSPYVVYLPKKDRSKILQTGIPYAKGGLVEKKY